MVKIDESLNPDGLRICSCCNVSKILNIENFEVKKGGKLGFARQCRVCRKIYFKKLRNKNKPPKLNIDNIIDNKVFRYCKICKENKELIYDNFQYEKRTKSGFANICRKCRQNKLEEFYRKNPDRKCEIAKKCRNTEKYKINRKKYLNKNRQILSKKSLERYHNDINHKIACSLRNLLRARVKRKFKNSHSIKYLGCSIEFFRDYILKLFKDGMSWENHGKIWELDHIIPCRAFDFSIEENIHKCFHYTNYQPEFRSLNRSKQDKLPNGEFARNIYSRN